MSRPALKANWTTQDWQAYIEEAIDVVKNLKSMGAPAKMVAEWEEVINERDAECRNFTPSFL